MEAIVPGLDAYWCIKYHDSPYWIYILKAVVALVIITENVVVMTALLQNWSNIARQHNLYRYLLSLVFADLLYGLILLLHGIIWLLNMVVDGGLGFSGENFQETMRNLITGVLHGSIFVSLASATLLNLVIRVTSTQALARAAAIPRKSQFFLGEAARLRSPKITWFLIGLIWTVTLGFICAPIKYHCHTNLIQCVAKNETTANVNGTGFIVLEEPELNMLNPNDDPSAYDCSVLKAPTRRMYLVVLSVCNTFLCCLMLLCNVATTCTKTSVQRVQVDNRAENTECDEPRFELRLRHSFGITRDASSFFACVITLSMTISTVPYIVFTFITEGGSNYDRIYYGETLAGPTVEVMEMTTYISSLVNPVVYTFMLSRLRSDVSRILDRKSFRATQRGHTGIRTLTWATFSGVFGNRRESSSSSIREPGKWSLGTKKNGSSLNEERKVNPSNGSVANA